MGFDDHDKQKSPLDQFFDRVDALIATGKVSKEMAQYSAALQICNRHSISLNQLEDMIESQLNSEKGEENAV